MPEIVVKSRYIRTACLYERSSSLLFMTSPLVPLSDEATNDLVVTGNCSHGGDEVKWIFGVRVCASR